MAVNQKWSNVWPSARTFHPSSVPLPIHMGFVSVRKNVPRPTKWNNLELMKIPNFLHLSPPAVKMHCEAIKKFCTEWPKALNSDEMCEKHFPIEVKTQQLVFSGDNIRWPDARVVELQIKMSSLQLDYHAKDKMRRLLRERYDPKTDMISIVADRCPLQKQNYDYSHYLLTAVYFESWVCICFYVTLLCFVYSIICL